MIRALLLTSALATLAPAAEAGGFSVLFGIGDRDGNSVRVKVGSKSDRHRHERNDRVIKSRRHDDSFRRDSPARRDHGRRDRVRHDQRRRDHRGHDHARHAPRYRTVTERVWVRGHFDRVAYKVRIAETHRRVHVPARYEYRTDRCGKSYRVMVRRAYYKTVCQPARYETRYKSVFHRGRYETRTKRIRI